MMRGVLPPLKSENGTPDLENENVITTTKSADLEFLPTLHAFHPSHFVHRCWTRATEALRNAITRFDVVIAVHAANYPYLWIVSIVCISLAILASGGLTNFRLELDFMNMFTPTTSQALKQREWALSGSRLPGYAETSVPFKIVIHRGGKNVISYEGVERAFEVLKVATNINGINHLCSENEELMIDLDAGYTGYCEFQAITGFWGHKQADFEQQVLLNGEVTDFLSTVTYPDGTTVDMDRIVGNLELNQDGLSAQSLYVEIAVPLNGKWMWDRLSNYTYQLEAAIEDLQKVWESEDTDYTTVFVFNFNVGNEFQATILGDFPLLPVSFMLMLLFCFLVFWKRHRVQSRLLLAVGSIFTVFLSLSTGFGIMFLFGVPYTVVTTVLPFFILGVALDDTFIIYEAFERLNPNLPIVGRIEEVFEEVGLSITLTTLTTALAFGLGSMSTIPAVRDLCFYAFPTVFIDGFYQISFFVSLLTLDERRIQAHRMDCCPCFVIKQDESSSSVVTVSGATDSSNEISDSDDNQVNSGVAFTRDSAKQAVWNQAKPRSFSSGFMGWYADQLLRPWVKLSVLFTFAALFAGFAYSAALIRQDFSFFDLLPSDSLTKAYLTSLETFGGFNTNINIYFRGMNQTEEDIQSQMIDYIDQITAIDHVHLRPFCWVKDFKLLRDDPDTLVAGLMEDPEAARLLDMNPEVQQFLQSEISSSTIDSMTFNQLLDFMFSQPLIEKLYSQHVIRHDNGTISASRCVIAVKKLDGNNVNDQLALLRAQKAVTNSHPLNQNEDINHYHAFLYNDILQLWEFFDVAMTELRLTAITGVVSITFFAFLFMPHWSGVFYVFPLMCILYVNLLGMFQVMGLSVNVLTYVILVVSVGLLVDFLMHVLLRYYESTGETRNERVKETLETIGGGVLLGGASTFLGSLPLVFSQSAVFRTVYLAFFAIIFLGVSHGLVLLPVLLSFLGTTSTTKILQCQTNVLVKTITSYKSHSRGSYQSQPKLQEDDKTQGSSSSSSHATGVQYQTEVPVKAATSYQPHSITKEDDQTQGMSSSSNSFDCARSLKSCSTSTGKNSTTSLKEYPIIEKQTIRAMDSRLVALEIMSNNTGLLCNMNHGCHPCNDYDKFEMSVFEMMVGKTQK